MNRTSTASALTSRRSLRGVLLSPPWIWLVPLIVLCALAAGAYFFFFSAKPPGEQQRENKRGQDGMSRPVPVTGAPVTTGDINVYLNGLGSVTPLNTVTVRSRVDGQLMRVLFREGQIVKPGELLAEIDPRPFQVQLTQAEGQLARDVALLENARTDLARYQVLLEQDSIAEQQLATQAALVRQYEGAVKTDRGAVDNARLQLIYSRVTAPLGGRIGLRLVDPGNIVHATDTTGLVVITQLQPIAVIFTLPEDNLPAVMDKLQHGDKLVVDAYDRSGRTKLATGYLLTVDNQIDAATGTVKLKAQFANETYKLFPNQFVNVRMLLDVERGVTRMPTAGVQRGTQGTFAYVIKSDNTVTMRTIKLGPTEGDFAAVVSGLAPGEQVVVDGSDKLREGAKVEPISKDTTAAPSDGARPHQGGGKRRREGGAAPGN
jgi:multidrug efflux system membrane fusion protein